MGGGALYAPPLIFLPFTQNIFSNPYLKILDPTKLFIADAPIKKNLKLLFYPLSEHFEIWVRKPPMAERVNRKSGVYGAAEPQFIILGGLEGDELSK